MKELKKGAACLGLALGLAATMNGLRKGNEHSVDGIVSSIATQEDFNNFDRDCLYDDTRVFTQPLPYYAFHDFPKTYRTDVDLETMLDAYGISYEDYVNTFVRVIYACGGANNYEEAYALTTLILNRLMYGNHVWGDNIVNIITTRPQQFPVYMMGAYKGYNVEELENYVGWQAIQDCLINFAEDQTNRMHNCMHYVNPEVAYTNYKFSSVGNQYGSPLKEELVVYQNISLGGSRKRLPKEFSANERF